MKTVKLSKTLIIKIEILNGVFAHIEILTGNTIFYKNGNVCKINKLTLFELNLIHQRIESLD